MSSRNTKIYIISQFLYALVFTIPIWIVYYQGRISASQIGFLVGFQYAVQLILELPTGALADLVGRKFSIALGYLLWALFYVIVIKTSGFYALVVATFFGGLAESLISGSLEALVYDSLKQDGEENSFVKISAKNGIIFQIGLAVATFSGGFLYSVSWMLPYIACAVANAIAFSLALFFVEPTIDSQKFSVSNYLRQIEEGTVHAFATRSVALMSLFYICVSAITWTNNLYFFDFMLVELDFSAVQRSLIGATIRIINVSILGILLKNDHIFTRNRSIFFFPSMMLICFLPGIFFHGIWALPFVAGAVMTGTARWIILTRYTNEMFESKYRATSISALSMVVGVLFVLITFISGPIIENFGGVRVMYSLLGLLTLCTVTPLSIAVIKNFNVKSQR